MAKPYKLMRIEEGDYNIRDRISDEVVGTIRLTDDKWCVTIFEYADSLASKDKAVGFVRGVYAAKNGSNNSVVSSELKALSDAFEDLRTRHGV